MTAESIRRVPKVLVLGTWVLPLPFLPPRVRSSYRDTSIAIKGSPFS